MRRKTLARIAIALEERQPRVRAEDGAREERRARVAPRAGRPGAEPPAQDEVTLHRRVRDVRRPQRPDTLAPLTRRGEHVRALAGMGLEIMHGRTRRREVPQDLDERAVLPNVADVAGVKAVAVGRD